MLLTSKFEKKDLFSVQLSFVMLVDLYVYIRVLYMYIYVKTKIKNVLVSV